MVGDLLLSEEALEFGIAGRHRLIMHSGPASGIKSEKNAQKREKSKNEKPVCDFFLSSMSGGSNYGVAVA